ncbi:MAG: hypothetical protein GX316_10650 [Firmicutes bacterium]|nr:hypothetical protein [Bacillota bacterium]
MRKSLVFALIMVLAMAGLASAEVKIGGDFKVEYVIDTDKEGVGTVGAGTGKGKASAPLTLALSVEEEDVWSVNADVEANAVGGSDLSLGEWSMNLTDDLFVADLWGGGLEKSEVKTPLEFVKAGKKGEADSAKLRISSDVAGYVDLTLDYQPDTLFLFADKALDDVTVGGAVKTDLATDGLLGAGHVTYVTGPLTLTGEVGLNTAEEDKNTLIGGKVGYELSDKVTVNGKVTRKDENVGNEFVIEPGVVYEDSMIKATATYTWKDDIDNDKTKATNKVKAGVTYRSNDDVAYGDLFDDYDDLTGYAAFVEGAYTTASDYDGDDNPLTEVTLKAAGAAVPGMVWVKGELVYKGDKDAAAKDEDFDFIIGNNKLTDDVVLLSKSYYRFAAESTVQLTDKVQLKPGVKYATWDTLTVSEGAEFGEEDAKETVVGTVAKDMTELQLIAALTYALSDSSEVGLSYTNRNQKLDVTTSTASLLDDGEENELTDNFVKVWFKTSF